MLFFNISSDSHQLTHNLELETSLCNWPLDFLKERPQAVRVGKNLFQNHHVDQRVPQGCVLDPLLFTLLTYGLGLGDIAKKIIMIFFLSYHLITIFEMILFFLHCEN